MKNYTQIAVIGGSGKSGKYLVKRLLSQGYWVKLLLRNPEHFPESHPKITIVHVDAADYQQVFRLLEGCQAVISMLGLGIPASAPDIFTRSAQNVLQAMQRLDLRRYIVTTGLNVDTPFDSKGPKAVFGTDWMKQNFPVSTENKQSEYRLLADSPQDWTLIRLPQIVETENTFPVAVDLLDCPGDSISATDLADFAIAQLTDESFVRQAPFIANV